MWQRLRAKTQSFGSVWADRLQLNTWNQSDRKKFHKHSRILCRVKAKWIAFSDFERLVLPLQSRLRWGVKLIILGQENSQLSWCGEKAALPLLQQKQNYCWRTFESHKDWRSRASTEMCRAVGWLRKEELGLHSRGSDCWPWLGTLLDGVGGTLSGLTDVPSAEETKFYHLQTLHIFFIIDNWKAPWGQLPEVKTESHWDSKGC